MRHHSHKLALVEAGLAFNLQFPRQLLLAHQGTVFRPHPQYRNDQDGDDMDNQRVLPGGINHVMKRNDAVDREQRQPGGDDVYRRQQPQQQGVDINRFAPPQHP